MTTENYSQPHAQLGEQPVGVPETVSRAYQITIQQLDHGFLVNVGCKAFAIEDKDRLLARLNEYLSDVSGVTEAYFNKKFTI
jgi:hypothetical protein